MSRWRNIGLWVSAISMIPLALQIFGIVVPPEEYGAGMKVINAFLELLVTAGVLSNPTTANLWYRDDKNE
jgi:uncharacterized membrane protein